MKAVICVVLNLVSLPFWAIGFISALVWDALTAGKDWFYDFGDWVSKK